MSNMTEATAVKLVDAAIKASGTMSNKIQYAAEAILEVIKTTGDSRKMKLEASRLVNDATGIRGEALVEYFVQQGAEKNEAKEGGFIGWDVSKVDLAKARAKKWHEYKKVNPWQGYNLEKALRAQFTSVNNAQKKVKANPELASIVSVDKELLEGLRELLARHGKQAA